MLMTDEEMSSERSESSFEKKKVTIELQPDVGIPRDISSLESSRPMETIEHGEDTTRLRQDYLSMSINEQVQNNITNSFLFGEEIYLDPFVVKNIMQKHGRDQRKLKYKA